MGQCLSRKRSKYSEDALQSSYAPENESLDEFWDARSEMSFASACTFLLEDPSHTDQALLGALDNGLEDALDSALEDALEYQRNAKILKARDCLLDAADEEFWTKFGDDRVSRILEKASLVTHALDDMDVEEGYLLSREEPIRLLYKHEKGGTSHSIKIKAVLEHPIKHVVSIPYEWDLLPTWNKYALDAVAYGSQNSHETVVYGASWMIPPFRDFHAVLRASGFDVSEEHGCLVITVQDCEHLMHDLDLPLKAKDRKIVNFLDGCYIVLKPLFHEDAVHTDAVLSVHLDPHIPGIPASVINFVLHIFAPYLFKQVDKTLKSLFHQGSLYSKRIEASPDVYQLIDRAIDGMRRKS